MVSGGRDCRLQPQRRRSATGKLTEAAQRWAGGGSTATPASTAEHLRRAGAPADVIAGAAQPLRSASFEVLEEAWPVFCLFTVTPWRTAAWDGAWLGLEWTAAESLARALNVAWNAGAVGDLRVMEEAALTVMRARQRR